MEKHSKDIEKDFRIQQLEWPVLRVGWWLMGVFLILGVLGLFGSGKISWKTDESGWATIKYERYLRYSMPTQILIYPKGPLKDSSVYINADYLEKIHIEHIVPEPVSMTFSGDRLQVKFDSPHIKVLVFYIEPEERGPQLLQIGIGAQSKNFDQYIYF